jgi:hypothetical protein
LGSGGELASEGKWGGRRVGFSVGGGRGGAHVARTDHTTASGAHWRAVRHRRGVRRFVLLQRRPSRLLDGIHHGRRFRCFEWLILVRREDLLRPLGRGGRVEVSLSGGRREGEGTASSSAAVSSGGDSCEREREREAVDGERERVRTETAHNIPVPFPLVDVHPDAQVLLRLPSRDARVQVRCALLRERYPHRLREGRFGMTSRRERGETGGESGRLSNGGCRNARGFAGHRVTALETAAAAAEDVEDGKEVGTRAGRTLGEGERAKVGEGEKTVTETCGGRVSTVNARQSASLAHRHQQPLRRSAPLQSFLPTRTTNVSI